MKKFCQGELFMIMVCRKKKLVLYSSIFVLCVFFAGAWIQIFEPKETFLPSTGKTIIIDAGHDAKV